MDKYALHHTILNALEDRHGIACKAAQQAYESATHEENVAENKYDTLGLEASYLAEGQANRVAECEADIASFKQLAVQDFDDDKAISLGALVRIVNQSQEETLVFLSPVSGGLKIDFNTEQLMLVTLASPLGNALKGSYLGDEFSVSGIDYEILDVS